jgi:hypothetical protein
MMVHIRQKYGRFESGITSIARDSKRRAVTFATCCLSGAAVSFLETGKKKKRKFSRMAQTNSTEDIR